MIFREILRRMDHTEVLDFETIEELWNYQLDGTGVTIAQMRETGSSPSPTRRGSIARRPDIPDPVGQDRDPERGPRQAGLPSLPPYTPQEAPTGDPFTLLFAHTATLAHGQSLNNPLLDEVAPSRSCGSIPAAPSPSGSPTA